jgi:hypothetical protein
MGQRLDDNGRFHFGVGFVTLQSFRHFIRINLIFGEWMVGLGGIWENAQKAINYMLLGKWRLISLEDTPLMKGKKENADARIIFDDGVGNEIRTED